MERQNEYQIHSRKSQGGQENDGSKRHGDRQAGIRKDSKGTEREAE